MTMIPLQTILALLALLAVMGCSQLAPPHTPQALGQVGSSPTPTQVFDPSTAFKPDEKSPTHTNPELNVLTLTVTPDARDLEFKFAGLDAQRLYAWSEIEAELEDQTAKTFVKKGEFARCRLTATGSFECGWTMHLLDGQLVQMVDSHSVKTQPQNALYRPEKNLIGTNINFSQNPSAPYTDDKGLFHPSAPAPFFQVVIQGSNAKNIFLALGRSEENISSKEKPDTLYAKKGEKINCTHDLTLSPGALAEYECRMFGNLKTGSFENIL